MAKVLGESGRYVSDEAARKRGWLLAVGILMLTILGAAEGFFISLMYRPSTISPASQWAAIIGVLLFMWVVCKVGFRKLETLDKEQLNYQKGADGENIVSRVLAKFPDDFMIIHDLKTPFGNLDHVVVGPTGVFVLDTKNWRGVVSTDGKGELVLNGKPTSKPEIRQFTARLMSVKEKIKLLASGLDPFHKGLFVFTAARIDARWGTTRNVHCLSENQLHDYIVETNFGKRLKKAEVDRLSRAFLGLAQMDSEVPEVKVNRPVQGRFLAPA
jgi:hypothetical protein